MTGKKGLDGVRGVSVRVKLDGFFKGKSRMRVTATAELAEDVDTALRQRERVRSVMDDAKRTLALEGIGFEMVVGKPRNAETFTASLEELAGLSTSRRDDEGERWVA